jgi:hypothetical protein
MKRRKMQKGAEGRQGNLFPTEHLKLSTTPQVMNALEELVSRGLYGKTNTEVAEGLIRAKLLEFSIPIAVLQRERKPPQASKVMAARRKRA